MKTSKMRFSRPRISRSRQEPCNAGTKSRRWIGVRLASCYRTRACTLTLIRQWAEKTPPITCSVKVDSPKASSAIGSEPLGALLSVELIKQLSDVPESKAQHLNALVRQILTKDPSEKVLVFTQYYGTQDLLTELLAPEFTVVQFRGTMSRWEKDEAVARFRDKAQIMVSTEAGGEGRNFQFCHIIVNYDLHWNPIRIDQHIGRLDRDGQKRDDAIY